MLSLETAPKTNNKTSDSEPEPETESAREPPCQTAKTTSISFSLFKTGFWKPLLVLPSPPPFALIHLVRFHLFIYLFIYPFWAFPRLILLLSSAISHIFHLFSCGNSIWVLTNSWKFIWVSLDSIRFSFAGYLSDEESPRSREKADMSVFRDAVQDCLDYELNPEAKTAKPIRPKASCDPEVERFSGLRIR